MNRPALVTGAAGLAVGAALVATLHGTPPAVPIVPPEPATAPASAVPQAPRVSTPLRAHLFRATLRQVAQDFGIRGRLDCRVVPK